ncbi:hypothetical protein CR513_62935, partial [Mucuna pruriens]
MAKKDHEGFKEYAQKWCELAAQVQPPLIEKEMVSTFIDTLPSPFYEIVIGSVSPNFTDLVIIGERVEVGLKRGKFTSNTGQVSFTRKAKQEKKKGEANAVIVDTTSRVLDPIPVLYIELFRTLLEKKLISIVPLKPAEPPYSKSYDPNTRCEYHGGGIRHPTERCWGLKHKVEDLIDEGWLVF